MLKGEIVSWSLMGVKGLTGWTTEAIVATVMAHGVETAVEQELLIFHLR